MSAFDQLAGQETDSSWTFLRLSRIMHPYKKVSDSYFQAFLKDVENGSLRSIRKRGRNTQNQPMTAKSIPVNSQKRPRNTKELAEENATVDRESATPTH
ncbi:hypothetical protein [uncultured Slackia sp.]|uniref:hypothetical protein n=1 Tax=uncultured Slackia sp. TaxID=665903 RepID=UPI0025EE7763|nr:hypothetical protein [uncultured Slackia sp.]